MLETIYTENNFPPSRIFNVDETGFSNVPKWLNRIIATKGKKQVGGLTSGERGKTFTTEICVSASGEHLPLLFIFPQRMSAILLTDTPEGTWGLAHKSGWMQSDLFLQWMKWFIDQVKPTDDSPVLLILDGHYTHTKKLDTIKYARAHFVTMLCLPPHCTHRLQPLDVSVMQPMSRKYSSAIED